MGIKNIITDDLTDEVLSGDTQPVSVRVDGEDYSVYLGEESKETFIAFLKGEAPLLKKATITTTARRRTGTANRGGSIDTFGHNAGDVRAWAVANKIKNDNGKPVGDKGRLSQSVYKKYDEFNKSQD